MIKLQISYTGNVLLFQIMILLIWLRATLPGGSALVAEEMNDGMNDGVLDRA